MEQYPKTYCVTHKDFNTRMNSRSGGIFTAISDYVLKCNGAVCGAVIGDDFLVHHEIAWDQEGRDRFRGSKYIQSDIGNCFLQIKQILEKGKWVLFSGTGCQSAALLRFLNGVNTEKLITLDVVCHGVPSPLIWQDYLEEEKKKHGAIHGVEFRNKKDFGWHDHYSTVYTDKGKYHSEQFTKLFYNHYILRPSCSECPFTTPVRKTDFTIADFWDVGTACPEMEDNYGVSLVFIQNERAERIFELIKADVNWKETDLQKSIASQPMLREPSKAPADRALFWNDYKENGYSYVAEKYGCNATKSAIKREVKVLLRKLNLRKI